MVVSQGAIGALGSALERMGGGTSGSDLPKGGQCLGKGRLSGQQGL